MRATGFFGPAPCCLLPHLLFPTPEDWQTRAQGDRTDCRRCLALAATCLELWCLLSTGRGGAQHAANGKCQPSGCPSAEFIFAAGWQGTRAPVLQPSGDSEGGSRDFDFNWLNRKMGLKVPYTLPKQFLVDAC